MVEVKICGVCRPEDARSAADAGAAWVGVILAPERTRTRTIAEAAAIFAASTARRVGVFVDPPIQRVIDAVRDLALDAVQLHGDESIDQIRRIQAAVACEIWKAIRVKHEADLARGVDLYRGHVAAILLDGWAPDAHGGAGVSFDWKAVAGAGLAGMIAGSGALGMITGSGELGMTAGSGELAHAPRPGARTSAEPDTPAGPRLIVAGGLTPDNVAAAVAVLHPAVVDVSSGVEVAPGRKSPEKIHAFVAAARGNGNSP
jgi:phosphoribosylanthranilate isomerase